MMCLSLATQAGSSARTHLEILVVTSRSPIAPPILWSTLGVRITSAALNHANNKMERY